MNELNELDPLETQLQSWKPRRPSATLERRLFRRAARGPRPALVAGWLAPAAACLLLLGSLLNPQSAATLTGDPHSGGLLALIASNQSYASYLPGSFERTHNQLEAFSQAGGVDVAAATNYNR